MSPLFEEGVPLPSRPTWHEQQPSPKDGDRIQCGPITIKVGYHNGDFRHILFEDHLGRPIGHGGIPYLALRQIDDAAKDGSA